MGKENSSNSEGQGWSREDKEQFDSLDDVLKGTDNSTPEERAKAAKKLDSIDSLELSEGAKWYLSLLIHVLESGSKSKLEMVGESTKAVEEMRERGDTDSDNYKTHEAFLILFADEI